MVYRAKGAYGTVGECPQAKGRWHAGSELLVQGLPNLPRLKRLANQNNYIGNSSCTPFGGLASQLRLSLSRKLLMGNQQGRSLGGRLTKKDIERLQRRFVRLAGGQGRVPISSFVTMVELGGNPFIPHIFRLFDATGDGYLTLEE